MSEATGLPDIDEFFTSRKKAAAALKHAVLRHYLTVFVTRTGSTARNNQVVVLDAYAGVGRYKNGDPGSPALVAAASLNHSARNRRILARLVEGNKAHYDRLDEVMQSEPAASTFEYQTFFGDVDLHLPTLLALAHGQPLLMFLDPYGLGPTCEQLAAIYASRSARIPGMYRLPATEVLLRFDARFIRLIHGHLRGYLRGETPPGRAGLIGRMDSIAGGTWWHEGAHLQNDNFRDWFIVNYLRHVSTAINGQALQVPVTETVSGDVKYYLIFLTLRREGFFSFLDTTSGAFQEWRRLVRDHVEDVFDQEDIQHWVISDDDVAQGFEEDEERLEAQWISVIESNIVNVLAGRHQFKMSQEYRGVLGDVLGFARTKHIRAALRALTRRGVTTNAATGDVWEIEVVAATRH